MYVQGEFGDYSILQSAELFDWDQFSWTATGKKLLVLTKEEQACVSFKRHSAKGNFVQSTLLWMSRFAYSDQLVLKGPEHLRTVHAIQGCNCITDKSMKVCIL